jgi:hypothetical protein
MSATRTKSARNLVPLIAADAGPRNPKPLRRKSAPAVLPESTVAFLLFLLVSAVLYVRPSELMPELAGLPIYAGLVLASCILAAKHLQWQFRVRTLRQQPISLCVLGLLPAVVLSHLSHLFLYGVKESGTLYLKVLVCYALLVTLVNTPRRMHWFLMATAVCSSLMIAMCVADFLGWHDFQFIKHLNARYGIDAIGNDMQVIRLRGTGIFEDPNDIALLIVLSGVICTYFLTDRLNPGLRFLWLVPLGFLTTGLVCTHSRGGLLAAGAAGAALIATRYGKKYAVAMGLLGLAGLSLMASRQGDVSLSTGTGNDRILLWRDGLEAIKSPDLLFGIGQGEYAEVAGLVAHNSFVHAFVELGLFGGTLFFGCFFFAGLALYRLMDAKTRIVQPELERLRPYIGAILAGWCAGMFSLSRCYVAPTYMVAGITATYITMAGQNLVPPRLLIRWDTKHFFGLIFASIGMLIGLVLLVKIFSR